MEKPSNSTVTTSYIGLPGERTLTLSLSLDQVHQLREEVIRGLKESRDILARRARRVRARARRVGFAAGSRASSRQIEALFEQTGRYSDIVLAARTDCLELCIAIAAEIVAADLVPNSDLLARRVEQAIGSLLDARGARIYTAPEDVDSLREALTVVPPERVIPDSTLSSGDAIIETSAGRLRLVWREHLGRIRERLLEEIRRLPTTSSGEVR